MVSVSADVDFKMKAVDVPDMDQDLAPDPSITHEITGDAATLIGSSSPPITKKFGAKVQLSSGVATIDLTALDDGNLPDIDLTGLKVQLVKIRALKGNAAAVTIKKGASDGYAIFGGTTPEVTLFADGDNGDIQMNRFNDTLPDVSATVKNIDLVGTGSDAVEVILMAG